MIRNKYSWRAYLIIFFLLIALGGLLWRLLDLNLMNRHFLLKQSDARALRVIDMPAHRGMITDRLGSVLGISSPVYSAWVNPKNFDASYSQLHELSQTLHLPVSTIEARAEASKKAFVYLKRQNPPEVMAHLKALQIPGLHFQMDYQRFYPEGESTSHVLGITNIDDQGQEGLELAYNNWLSGTVGKKEVLKDRLGHIISEIAVLKKPQEGRDLNLSIDHRIQYIAYRALKEQVENLHAEAGSVVVLDPKTGEILAMANVPSYNPNSRLPQAQRDFRNRAVTDSFEPGSSMKPFTIALALESGKYTPTSTIDTHPGYMSIGGFEIRDDFHDNGVINLQKILELSSNIGAAKILLSLPPTNLWNLLRRLGFGDKTSSGFPGESSGRLVDHAVWYKSEVATLAYGYGVSVTALQLARAYAILAEDGENYPISFLKLDAPPKGERVIPEKVAKEVDTMLESVVYGKQGTAHQAQVPGYTVAGKTGTAYIAGANGYDKKRYVGDFIGFAPAMNPRLVIAVVIRDPHDDKHRHFGGETAAPVFAKVMAASLRLLNVSPDNLKSNQP
jgi:cell division protein FtsI (penicillin-binding protein 3)